MKESDELVAGKVVVRTVWSEDLQTLISKYEMNTQKGQKGVLINTRFLENEDTLVHTIQLTLDGKKFDQKKRIYKKKKKDSLEVEKDSS